MFKRICFCMIVMLFCLSLFGCGNSDVASDGTSDLSTEGTSDVATELIRLDKPTECVLKWLRRFLTKTGNLTSRNVRAYEF